MTYTKSRQDSLLLYFLSYKSNFYADKDFLPLSLLRASTFLPFDVDILFLNPCTFFLCLFFG